MATDGSKANRLGKRATVIGQSAGLVPTERSGAMPEGASFGVDQLGIELPSVHVEYCQGQPPMRADFVGPKLAGTDQTHRNRHHAPPIHQIGAHLLPKQTEPSLAQP